MEIRATHKNARMTPRKLRLLRPALVGLPAREAAARLKYLPGKASVIVHKVLKSAIANAKENFDVGDDQLRVADVIIDAGLLFRRWQPVSRGTTHPILKRTSHVTVILEEQAGVIAKKVRRPGRQTEIDTMTASEYAKQRLTDEPHDHLDDTHETAPSDSEPLSVDRRKEPEEYTAFQKMKMQQQGGDKKKTHRRKSI